MNLWVKTLRQLTILSVAFFFFSCEDESSLLGFKNPNRKFNVRYVDIPLTSEVMTVDSLITDLRPTLNQSGQTQFADGLLIGQYQDPQFGNISAQSFASVYYAGTSALNTTAVFDSATIQLRLNFYAYGFSGKKTHRIPVHEITGDTLTLFNGNRYYFNSAAPVYSTEPIGEATISVHYDSLLKEGASPSNQQDTLLATGRLSDDFGMRVFNAIKSGVPDSEFEQFRSQIKGLALLPDTEPGIVGVNVINTNSSNNLGQFSRVIIYYHTLTEDGNVDDTLATSLGFDYASFTKIEADRAGTELSTALLYEPFSPASDQRYIQSGAPVITKLDLSPFYSFADTVEDIVINSAELVIDGVSGPQGKDPHNSLMLRLMSNSTNQFLNNRIAADRELGADYYVLSGADKYYVVSTEGSTPSTLNYNKDDGRLSGFVTLFAQTLFSNKNNGDGVNDNRLKYIALVPASPSFNRAVTQTSFNKDNVSLRIFYTRANTAIE